MTHIQEVSYALCPDLFVVGPARYSTVPVRLVDQLCVLDSVCLDWFGRLGIVVHAEAKVSGCAERNVYTCVIRHPSNG